MTECKKPLSVCETGNGESGEQIVLADCFPTAQSTTAPPGAQAFSALLRRGEENAVTVAAIAEAWDTDARRVTLALYAARRRGEPICSSGLGLFLPRDVGDVLRCLRSMRHRAREIEDSADALEQAWKEAGG